MTTVAGVRARGRARQLARGSQAAGSAAHARFWRRMLLHIVIAIGLLGFSLAVGMWGYGFFEHLAWRDAFLNAAMLLGGMRPIETQLSESGKLFAGLYALYSGLVVIAVTGLLLAPGVHYLMHHVEWNDPAGES
jgi:hypothetical protein